MMGNYTIYCMVVLVSLTIVLSASPKEGEECGTLYAICEDTSPTLYCALSGIDGVGNKICMHCTCIHESHCHVTDNDILVCRDPCEHVTCQHEGICNPTTQQCMCTPAYSGLHCETAQMCSSNPCQNNGMCVCGGVDGHICTCTSGYTGANCEFALMCSSNPCQNNGMCVCGGVDGHTCTCASGYTGANCEIDLCEHVTCQHEGICNPTTQQCMCTSAYSGFHCETALMCTSIPCQNGGTCVCGVVGGHTCTCTSGFTGANCEFDLCEHVTCQHEGICNPTTGQCLCTPAHSGNYCETAPMCSSNPCQNGGTCVCGGVGGHICTCTYGFTGADCEFENGGNGDPIDSSEDGVLDS